MVEFALPRPPVLLLVLLAILKFGPPLYNYITLTDAAPHWRATTGRRPRLKRPVQRGRASEQATHNSIDLTPAGDVTTSITNDSATGINCPTATDLVSGNPATVYAQYPYSVSIMGINFFSGYLKAQATERIE